MFNLTGLGYNYLYPYLTRPDRNLVRKNTQPLMPPQPHSLHKGWAIVAGLTAGWLLWMTLRPDLSVNGINLIPFREHSRALTCLFDAGCTHRAESLRFVGVNIIGNVAVFVPLGLALAGLWPGSPARRALGRAILGGGSLSMSIELLQLLIPSRATDIDDVIFNSTGALLGGLLYLAVWRKPTKSTNLQE
jgi:glycopeptide antibiotics resistance protein